MVARKKCFRGHALTPENTHVREDGERSCRECRRYGRRLRDAGVTLSAQQRQLERFLGKVDFQSFRPGACWVWTAAKFPGGYGDFQHKQAHRVALEFAGADVPESVFVGGTRIEVDHLCRNTSCVRPSHLRITDSRTNFLASDGPAARNARKRLCKRGHRLRPRPQGGRRCDTCNNAYSKAKRMNMTVDEFLSTRAGRSA